MNNILAISPLTNRKITVIIKTVYGNEMIYPACDDAKLFAQLAGKKTFSESDIRTIKDLGYTILLSQKPNTL